MGQPDNLFWFHCLGWSLPPVGVVLTSRSSDSRIDMAPSWFMAVQEDNFFVRRMLEMRER
eukprot:750765-Hanusia_phi.AAC.1